MDRRGVAAATVVSFLCASQQKQIDKILLQINSIKISVSKVILKKSASRRHNDLENNLENDFQCHTFSRKHPQNVQISDVEQKKALEEISSPSLRTWRALMQKVVF